MNADAKDTKAIAYVKDADAKIGDIIDADADLANAKVFGVDRNTIDVQQLIKSNFSKPSDDKLEGKLKNTDVADFKKEIPEENVANQFREFLRLIKFDKIVSWKVGRSKLSNRCVCLHATGRIVSHATASTCCAGLGGPPWLL